MTRDKLVHEAIRHLVFIPVLAATIMAFYVRGREDGKDQTLTVLHAVANDGVCTMYGHKIVGDTLLVKVRCTKKKGQRA